MPAVEEEKLALQLFISVQLAEPVRAVELSLMLSVPLQVIVEVCVVVTEVGFAVIVAVGLVKSMLKVLFVALNAVFPELSPAWHPQM